jgi:soluble cytochrome b562
MGYQQGEIYFIREVDRATKGFTPFVKIGLVRDAEDRDSFNRLVEHQTGNPRQLDLDRSGIVYTPAVDLVEAQLHRFFAPKRVSGEWFEFDSEEQIKAAIETARNFALDASERVPVFEVAEQLKFKESTLGTKPASAEDLVIAKELAGAKLQIAACKAQQARIAAILQASIDAGADVASLTTTTLRSFKPQLQEGDLQAAHPDIFEKYLAEVRAWQQRFLTKVKVHDGEFADPDFDAALSDVISQLAAISGHEEAGKVNEPNLALKTLLGLANWSHDFAEARLKVSIGLHEAIDGICTWKRGFKVDMKFDAHTFATENPELAKEFTSEASTKTYVSPKGTKSN